MKILIELPTWLGDSVMITPAIENLVKAFTDPKIILIGSFMAIEVLKNHPKVVKTYVLDKNYINLVKFIINLEAFDVFLSFRSSFRSTFLKLCVSAVNKYQFDKKKYNEGHQVEKYNNFVNASLGINTLASKLVLHIKKNSSTNQKKLLGINPGASYGSAKRWYPEKFANVAISLANEYDIIIFGGFIEKEFAKEIETYLIKKNVNNFLNLAGKTSINELINKISNLDLFITGDSGPMHLAAAFQIPTVSIFGPTKHKETSQWMNQRSIVLTKNLDCQPCMKRVCPLKHHNCMKKIESTDVLNSVKAFN